MGVPGVSYHVSLPTGILRIRSIHKVDGLLITD